MRDVILCNWKLILAIGFLVWIIATAIIFIQVLSYMRRVYSNRIGIPFLGVDKISYNISNEAFRITKVFSILIGLAEVLIVVIICLI